MHRHEIINLLKTKQAPSDFVSVFLGLLTVSYYSTTKMPAGLRDAWSPLAKCCTWNAADAPALRTARLSRGQWSCTHADVPPPSRAVWALHPRADRAMGAEPRCYGGGINAFPGSGTLDVQGCFFPRKNRFHKCWTLVPWNRYLSMLSQVKAKTARDLPKKE